MSKRIAALLLVLLLLCVPGASAALAGDAAMPETAEAEEEDAALPRGTDAAARTDGDGEAAGQAEADAPEGGEAPAVEEAAEAPAKPSGGTLSFESLSGRMREAYYPLLALEENIAALRAAGGSKDTLRQLENARDQMLLGGESLYITLAGLEAQDAALSRTIAALDRTVRELELRHELGQISELQLVQVKNGRTQAASGQQTLRMNIDTARLQLKAMAGVAMDGTLKLSALPGVTGEQLSAMDLSADLARAMDASYELYEAARTRDEAEKSYAAAAEYGISGAKNSQQAARYTYENAKQSFEIRFRTLYARVKNCAQVLEAARSALAAQEKSYAASALKYEQGNLSANALADAKDELAEAKETAANAERELFSNYRSYCWAVEYGILNG